MPISWFESWNFREKPVIGMLHLPALPGSPGYGGDWAKARETLLRDVDLLRAGGVDGLMMENFGDVPFYPGRVPVYVATAMTALAMDVSRATDLPLGINVLRNDGQTALAVANAVGAQFIRVNVLCGARVADQGLLQGIAHDLLRERAMLGASHIRILADVDVKHSAPLAARPIADEVDDTIERGLADGLVVSGAGTGKTTDLQKVRDVHAAVAGSSRTTPILIGSGITAQSIRSYFEVADGFIVGTALKHDGVATAPIDPARVEGLMRSLKR